jgi:hypothetical protein
VSEDQQLVHVEYTHCGHQTQMALNELENLGYPRIMRGGWVLLPQEECPECIKNRLFKHQ